jgi:hypothetical protein
LRSTDAAVAELGVAFDLPKKQNVSGRSVLLACRLLPADLEEPLRPLRRCGPAESAGPGGGVVEAGQVDLCIPHALEEPAFQDEGLEMGIFPVGLVESVPDSSLAAVPGCDEIAALGKGLWALEGIVPGADLHEAADAFQAVSQRR